MPAGQRRKRLDVWLREELTLRFEGRILSVDPPVAESWGHLILRSRIAGRPMGIVDGFLAATAQVHRLTIVTRNVSDFSTLGYSVLNPWIA
jgi:hypothetical protein